MTGLGRVLRIGRVALIAMAAFALFAPVAHAAFGVSSFSARVEKADTTLETQAGGHPYVGITAFTFNATGNTPDDNVKDVRVDLPAGLISNPQATPTCTDTQLAASACPASSQLGTEEIRAVLSIVPVTIKVPIYNMVPAAGQISDFAFSIPVAGRTDIVGGIRDSGDYGLYFTIGNVSNAVGLLSSKLTFWGVPADSSHDNERGADLHRRGLRRRRADEQRRARHLPHEPDGLRPAVDDEARGRLLPGPGRLRDGDRHDADRRDRLRQHPLPPVDLRPAGHHAAGFADRGDRRPARPADRGPERARHIPRQGRRRSRCHPA